MERKRETTAKPSPPGQDSVVVQHIVTVGMPGLSMGLCSFQLAYIETLEIYLELQHNTVSAPSLCGCR